MQRASQLRKYEEAQQRTTLNRSRLAKIVIQGFQTLRGVATLNRSRGYAETVALLGLATLKRSRFYAETVAPYI